MRRRLLKQVNPTKEWSYFRNIMVIKNIMFEWWDIELGIIFFLGSPFKHWNNRSGFNLDNMLWHFYSFGKFLLLFPLKTYTDGKQYNYEIKSHCLLQQTKVRSPLIWALFSNFPKLKLILPKFWPESYPFDFSSYQNVTLTLSLTFVVWWTAHYKVMVKALVRGPVQARFFYKYKY